MKTIEELVYYCKECEPVGALLLSGEWGCGKTHLIEHDPEQARQDIFRYIELYYNTERIHSALGWLSPVQFESQNA